MLSMKKLLKGFLLLMLFLIGTSGIYAQKRVTGTVLDKNQKPVAGANIVITGTTQGTMADDVGKYSIEVPPGSKSLTFTFVGMEPQEISIGTSTQIDVTMVESAVGLGEVVVVGYGTQKKTSVTASVSSIKGIDIVAQPVSNLNNNIVGRVAGLISTQASGEPGQDNATILIRGIGTLGNNAPLTIVDGVPRNYSNLDPNSIASISILKDAAAVAPYGMGGANGVILITTKKGISGEPTLSYDTYVGFQNPTVLTKFVNAYQYATLFNAADDNADAPHAYSNYALQKYKDHSSPDLYPDHNVLKELITPNALITNHNLTISGGSEKIRYYAGLNYIYQAGMWGPTNYKRYNLTANIDADATKTTKVNLSVNGRVEDREYPAVSAGSIFYQAFRTPPNAPLTFSNGLPGSYIGRSAAGNIFGSGNTNTIGYTMLTQFSIEQQLPFIKGLSAKGAVSYDFNPFNPTDPNNPSASITTFNRTWSTPILFYRYDSTSNKYPLAGNDGPAKPGYSESYNQSQAFTYQFYLNYHRTFGNHDFTGLVVLESRNTKSSVFGAQRVNYNINIPELNNGSSNSSDISNYGYSSETKQRSAVYRFSYSYANKYLFEASGRYDGNYYFAPGHRTGFFPAFSAGWRLSEERFIKEGMPWINNLKIKGSYGESGALAGSPFQYLSSYTLYGNASVLNSVTTQGLYENSQANPNITWERAKKSDIGLEASILNSLLTIEADYFSERRSNMLFPPTVTVPQEYGVALSQVNAGEMSNKGIEFTIGSSKTVSKDLRIGLTANFTYARNKLLQVFETAATFDNPNRHITNRPSGTQFGYDCLGYFTAADFNSDGSLKEGIANQPFNTTLHPGDLRYADLSGPNGVPDGQITPDDMKPIGKPATPEIIYGFSPTVSYKWFDFSLFFQGAASRNFYMSVFAFDNSSSAIIDALDYWTPTHQNATYPRITTQPTSNNTQASSWWIRDGSYLRLKTGQLGYTFSQDLMRKIHMQSARIYVSGQNLLTWSKIKNFDPEISSSSGQYYPQQKVISFGLNLTF